MNLRLGLSRLLAKRAPFLSKCLRRKDRPLPIQLLLRSAQFLFMLTDLFLKILSHLVDSWTNTLRGLGVSKYFFERRRHLSSLRGALVQERMKKTVPTPGWQKQHKKPLESFFPLKFCTHAKSKHLCLVETLFYNRPRKIQVHGP